MSNPFAPLLPELAAHPDPGIRFFVEIVGPPDQTIPSTHTLDEAILSIVIAQLLSAKAAKTIKARILNHFGSVDAFYRWLLTEADERPAHGLSGSKIKSLKSWASSERRRIGLPETIHYADLAGLFDGIRGFGPWSRDMLAIFHLALPDVWPLGDLVVRKAAERLWHNATPPVPSKYHTLLALSCWHATHIGIDFPNLVDAE